ncbi:hypothetical protein AR158_c070L [Paramecium bursaria Chlorella virus AR158]|uniref:hypothetical protein n=1 Tax=Paramecium bursaria Chlorella virus AR158 TaxID=380598 RepID=UPI00015AA779|nr:hypothetical protein AR158_c070L [Paramecium bursaria Chlorella virus AR158]ABU43616.1 hypothetical protein AR158_c070L [Paramecium bursaria Chlorella virus AR158]
MFVGSKRTFSFFGMLSYVVRTLCPFQCQRPVSSIFSIARLYIRRYSPHHLLRTMASLTFGNISTFRDIIAFFGIATLPVMFAGENSGDCDDVFCELCCR